MKIITYRVTLLEPALVTSVDGDPNSAVAYDFLPGSVLRGAIVKKYLAAQPALTAQNLLQGDSTEAQRLFFNGKTRYLNGYLEQEGARLLPAPLAWQQPADEPRTIYDFSVAEISDERKWHGYADSYCRFDHGQVRVAKPRRQIAVHTQRDRVYGRPRKGSGEVYRYESLAAGQTFGAAIVCAHDADAPVLAEWLPGNIHVGGSRTGGYGHAQIDQVQVVENGAAWREVDGGLMTQVNQRLTLTLLSDALLRDAEGQFVVDARVVVQYYQARLQVPILPVRVPCKPDAAPSPDDPLLAFVRGRVVGGFNRKWGLPLPQALVVQAGSTIVFDTRQCGAAQLDLLMKQLKELEQAGIGERRAEGFGRVAANWHTSPTWKLPEAKEEPQPEPVPVTGEAATVAGRMAQRLLRAQLDDRLVATANALKIKAPPKRAQLARLRNIISNELLKQEPDALRVKAYLELVRDRSTARKQFEAAMVTGDNRQRIRLSEWLLDTAQIADEQKFKQLLGITDDKVCAIGTVKPEVGKLRAEYVLRLIDLVLAHAAKEVAE